MAQYRGRRLSAREHFWMMVSVSFMASVWHSAEGQMSSTTTTTTTISTSPCPAVNNCTNNPNCSTCLNALVPIMREWNTVYNAGFGSERTSDIAFFGNLTNSPCLVNDVVSPLLPPAIVEVFGQTCTHVNFTIPLFSCLSAEFDCALDPTCRQCLRDIYASTSANDRSDVLNGSSCRATHPQLLRRLEINCYESFPSCTYSKLQCESDPTHNCSGCVALLREGDATGAVQQCSQPPSSSLIDDVVNYCMEFTDTTCAFAKARCSEDQVCDGCLAAIIDAQTPEAFAGGFLNSSDCLAFSARIANQSLVPTNNLLFSVFYSCASITACQLAAFNCILYEGTTCATCLTSETPAPSCAQFLSENDIYASCHPCTSSVYENNRIVMATSAVAGMSILPCLFVIIVIVAYSKDLIYIRARIIIGIMVSNIVYSIGGAIPVALLQTNPNTCGQFALSFATIRFGRAWWFGGKYALIFFELLILGVSIWVIVRGGVHTVSPKREALLHTACALAGIAAFVGFMVKSTAISANGYNAATQAESESNAFSHINFDDDLNDDLPFIAARDRFQSSRNEYNRLVQQMLVVWSCLLGLAISLWLYLRWIFIKLTKLWSRSLVEAEEQWDRDLWAPSHQGIRQSKRRLLELIKEGYDEIARPLEPFVVIFIFFGVPACVMATDFCQESSQVKENGIFATLITVGKCDVVCELILAFRSMATVAVYFYPREHRTEVYHVGIMWRRLRARVSGWFRLGTSRRGSGVTFRGIMLEEVQMINAIGDECDDCKVDDDGDGDSRVARSTVPYQLMDTDDGAIASKNV